MLGLKQSINFLTKAILTYTVSQIYYKKIILITKICENKKMTALSSQFRGIHILSVHAAGIPITEHVPGRFSGGEPNTPSKMFAK